MKKTAHSAVGKLHRLGSITSAFLRMDLIDDISYPMSLLLTEVGTVFPVFIYFFIGGLVGENEVIGGDYFTFAVIGLAVTVILQAALSGFGGSLQRAQNRGTFEALLAEPVPWLFLPFGMNLWRTLLGLLNGFVVLGVGWLLGATYDANGFLPFLLLLALGVAASMGIGVLSASLMVLAKRSQAVLTLYGLASSLLGGALFSVDQLPGWIRPLSWAIPHTYVINASRTSLMSDPGSFVITPGQAIIALVLFAVIVLTLGLYLFHRSLEYGREMGILSGY